MRNDAINKHTWNEVTQRGNVYFSNDLDESLIYNLIWRPNKKNDKYKYKYWHDRCQLNGNY